MSSRSLLPLAHSETLSSEKTNGMAVHNKLDTTLKEPVAAKFRASFQRYPGGIEEKVETVKGFAALSENRTRRLQNKNHKEQDRPGIFKGVN
jgi:hypothetical protein